MATNGYLARLFTSRLNSHSVPHIAVAAWAWRLKNEARTPNEEIKKEVDR